MAEKPPLELECPTCKAKVLWNDDFPYRPFCSKRCQLIDFGEWANEEHRIKGNSLYDDVLSDDLEGR
ncbi:DNA gyrase inhibitor YacG [Exilibacterium tricleocarpae]|uniref:DNA gyrase inhibitor YacG n=1 Tax=Exilibacterium tricleocarpae TaxID=2591008 RepID=A0A545TQE9_9GAMM|nr:DNA gyrase inhibitor YacG [Exilibacterium tricleocarpae]TQV79455.1 DNA gyrase inhibitor YacG [Exilibacterium tricleocarpae]